MTNTTNKVFFITGVSSGLGRELAEAVLSAGGKVAGTLRKPEQVADFEALSPGNAIGLIADITDKASIDKAVAQAVDQFGRLDVIANNAGFGTVGAVEETSTEEAHNIFNNNFFGLHNVLQATLPVLRKQQSGHILTFSAIGGFTGFPGLGVYSAAKGAADVLSEAVAGEVADFGIKVTVLTLGIFRTKFASSSLHYTANEMSEYADTPAGKFRGFIGGLDGNQPNDPAAAAQAIIEVVESDEPPMHLALGADAVGVMRKKLEGINKELDAWEKLSVSTAYDKAS